MHQEIFRSHKQVNNLVLSLHFKASRGQREKVREHKDEHLDEERTLRESDADGRDNRQNQRSNRGEGEVKK